MIINNIIIKSKSTILYFKWRIPYFFKRGGWMYRTMIRCFITMLSAVTSLLFATTYQVGSGRTYATLQDVVDLLRPGDVVLVDGDATYPSGAQIAQNGTADKPITISGIRPEGGKRPLVKGTSTYGIDISADYIRFEGFEVRGRPKGIGVFGNNITVRDCIIDSCNHGLIGYGTGTGNVTVEYCEFFGNGIPTGNATQHQIYMATDEYAHPGSVFRLQFCYIHGGVEGDNVKSRAERNEIYYNWIENAGSSGHGMGLFAPDPEDNDQVDIATAREDADVVGNVVIQSRNACVRIGGDAPGYPTNGRYRFVNNTFICTGSRGDAIRTFNTIETLEMYNNAIFATQSGSDIRIVNDADGEWVHSPRSLIGSNNWVVEGATLVPSAAEWSQTIRGTASPFTNTGAKDFRPARGGPLVNAGAAATPTIAAYPFPKPLFPPLFHPPQATLIDTGTAEARPNVEVIDIGAFEASPANVADFGIVRPYSVLPLRLTDRMFGIDGRCIGSSAMAASGLRIVRFIGKGGVVQGKIVRMR
jgi:hypothetical protein